MPRALDNTIGSRQPGHDLPEWMDGWMGGREEEKRKEIKNKKKKENKIKEGNKDTQQEEKLKRNADIQKERISQ